MEDPPGLRVARQGHGCSSFMRDGKRASDYIFQMLSRIIIIFRFLLLPGA